MGMCISGSLAMSERPVTEMRECADEMTAAESLTVTALQDSVCV